MLKLTKTYFKDSEKQGRLAGVCQAALEGWGWCLLSHCGFPQGSSNSTHRAGGSILGDEVTSWGWGTGKQQSTWAGAASTSAASALPAQSSRGSPTSKSYMCWAVSVAKHWISCPYSLPKHFGAWYLQSKHPAGAAYEPCGQCTNMRVHAHMPMCVHTPCPFLALPELKVQMKTRQDCENHQVLQTPLQISVLIGFTPMGPLRPTPVLYFQTHFKCWVLQESFPVTHCEVGLPLPIIKSIPSVATLLISAGWLGFLATWILISVGLSREALE